MRRLILVSLALIVSLAPASVPTNAKERESNVIETARAIALATARLVETEEPRAGRLLEANITRATQRLKRMGKPARAELRKMLGEKRSYVTLCSAAYALYSIDSTEVDVAVETLLKQWNRTMFANVTLAQQLILAIGAPAVPTLTRHLNNSMVVHLLGAMGPAARDALPALKDVLGTSNVEVACALVNIGSEEAVAAAKPVLVKALEKPNSPYAKMAVICLGELGPKARDAVSYIREALHAVSADTRLYAGIALADVGDTKFATKALADLIVDKELHGRHHAIRKLSSLGPQAKSAMPALIRVLLDDTDKRYGDRALAGVAIANIDPNSPEGITALQKASRLPALRIRLRKLGLPPQQ